MSSILFYILLTLGVVRGDLQTQEYRANISHPSIHHKTKVVKFHKQLNTTPDRANKITEFTGQGSWEDK